MLEHVPPRGGLRWKQWLGRLGARTVGRKGLNPELEPVRMRRFLDDTAARRPFPRGVARVGGSLAGLPCAVLTPEHRTPGALLFIHGGGFIVGSSTSYGAFGARLARAVGLETWAPDYRLSPEHRFPDALNDVKACWATLSAKTAGPIVLAGDSAGGNLALSLALHLRDAGERQPDAIVLISPWTDLSMSGGSIEHRASAEPMLRPDGLAKAADMYLKGHDRYDPAVSPLFAEMAGLPPVLIQVGSDEILLDDSVRLEDRLAESGVDSLCQVWDRMWHDFQLFAPLVPEASDALDVIARWTGAQLDRRRNENSQAA